MELNHEQIVCSVINFYWLFNMLPPLASSTRPWPRATQCSGTAGNRVDSRPENESSLGTDSPPLGPGTGQDPW